MTGNCQEDSAVSEFPICCLFFSYKSEVRSRS